jgi:uncharacterized membrane protein YgdD (TMEM256/DUF423 family)
MDAQPNNPPLEKGEIRFPNDNRAVFVNASPDDDSSTLIEAMEIKKPAAVLLLIGGADDLDPALNTKIEQLLEQGLALAAADTNALIIDGGTKAGVMELMGKVIALRGRVTPLLGIAPKGKVTYPGGPAAGSITGGAELDPNHSHFVLVEGNDWPNGTEMMFKLVTELAKEAGVVAILINGGEETKNEVARAAKAGWPVIAIQGSGRVANDVALHVAFAEQGDFKLFKLEDDPQGFRELVSRLAESALAEAWNRFRQYDSTSVVNKANHTRLLSISLIIGVLGTLFALAQKQFALAGRSFEFIWGASVAFALLPAVVLLAVSFVEVLKPKKEGALASVQLLGGALSLLLLALALAYPAGFLNVMVETFKYLAMATPIGGAILLAGSNQFKNRRKWILLRAAAEAVRKEIYRYRARVGEYDEAADTGKASADTNEASANTNKRRDFRDEALRKKIVKITEELMDTEVNTGSLQAGGSGPPDDIKRLGDDGFSFLSGDRYIDVRLVDQMSWYQKQTAKLERQRFEFQIMIYVVGGGGSLLAAFGFQLWVALTTAAVTALTAWVTDFRLDVTLVKYNQTAAHLSNVKYWWSTLSALEKTTNRQTLVDTTEQILETEQSGWVQQMQDAAKQVTARVTGKAA